MTSAAWPYGIEWDYWYLGYEDAAIEFYLNDSWRDELCAWTKEGFKPSKEDVRRLFENGKTSYRRRGKTPYEWFQERHWPRLCDAIIKKYNLGRW